MGLVAGGARMADRDVEDDVADVGASAGDVDALKDRGAELWDVGFAPSQATCLLDEAAEYVADVVVFQRSERTGWAGACVITEEVEIMVACDVVLRGVLAGAV